MQRNHPLSSRAPASVRGCMDAFFRGGVVSHSTVAGVHDCDLDCTHRSDGLQLRFMQVQLVLSGDSRSKLPNRKGVGHYCFFGPLFAAHI